MYYEISRKKFTIIAFAVLVIATAVFGTLQAKVRFGGDLFAYWNNVRHAGAAFIYKGGRISPTDGSWFASFSALLRGTLQEKTAVVRPGDAPSIPVLMYHGIVDEPDGINVTREDFEEQLAALKNAGYETVVLSDLYAFLRGERQLPEKSFMITFDDGRKDSYYPVDPLLRAFGYRAVMFVITNTLLYESKYYLSAVELKGMARSGFWEIQPHTRNGHGSVVINESGEEGTFFGNKRWIAEKRSLETESEFRRRIVEDLQGAYRDIERLIGARPTGFAFPFSDFGQRPVNFPDASRVVVPEAEKLFPLLFAQVTVADYTANIPAGREESFLVKRVEVEAEWDAETLLRELENGAAKSLPYRDEFAKNNGWRTTWGSVEAGGGELRLKAVEGSAGAAAFLDGTQHWKNYTIRGVLQRLQGETVSLVAREIDPYNFLSCDFAKGRVALRQTVEKELVLVEDERIQNGLQGGDIGMWVFEGTAGCMLGGKTVVYAPLLRGGTYVGGVGVKSWDRTLGKSEAVLSAFRVEEGYASSASF